MFLIKLYCHISIWNHTFDKNKLNHHNVIMYQSYVLTDSMICVDARLLVTHYISHEWVIWIGLSHEQLNRGEDCGDV